MKKSKKLKPLPIKAMIHNSASPSAAGLPVSKPNRRGDDSSWWGGGNSQVIKENSLDFAKIWIYAQLPDGIHETQ